MRPCKFVAAALIARNLAYRIRRRPNNLDGKSISFNPLSSVQIIYLNKSVGKIEENVLSTEVMTPKHGFISGRFGFLTRSLGNGGSRIGLLPAAAAASRA